jgi:tetratricopeptide (TPR) repeat protein
MNKYRLLFILVLNITIFILGKQVFSSQDTNLDPLELIIKFQSNQTPEMSKNEISQYIDLFDRYCLSTIKLSADKSFEDLLKFIEYESLLKMANIPESLNFNQKDLFISYLESKFHLLVALQFRLEELYQYFDSETKIYYMANYLLHNREISKHKKYLLFNLFDLYEPTDPPEQKNRILNGINRMLNKVDLRLSESGNQIVQRSPYGIPVQSGVIHGKICTLLNSEKNPDTKRYLSQIADEIKTENKKYKKHQDYQIEVTITYPKELKLPPANRSGEFFLKAFEAHSHPEKIELYSQSIKLNPDFAPSYFNRAISYRELNKLNEAITDFDKAINLNPDLIEAYLYRGICFHDLKEFDEAISNYNEVIQKDPTNSTAYLNRALCYQVLENYSKAILDYSLALDMDCNNVTAKNNRGVCYRKTGKIEEALSDHMAVIELYPENTTALYNLGTLYWQKKDWKNVIECWERCLEIDPNHPGALENLPTAKVNFEMSKNKYHKKTIIIEK